MHNKLEWKPKFFQKPNTLSLWQYQLWIFKFKNTKLNSFWAKYEQGQRKILYILKYNHGMTWKKG